jgi:hypothetical protein
VKIKIQAYKIIIFPVILYGCETWALTLREKHKLRTFENRVLRRIFEPKREAGENCIIWRFITSAPYLACSTYGRWFW